jgi:hypothetical protein
MDCIELADGEILLYQEAFLPPELAGRYFIELRDHCAWPKGERESGRHTGRGADKGTA